MTAMEGKTFGHAHLLTATGNSQLIGPYVHHLQALCFCIY